MLPPGITEHGSSHRAATLALATANRIGTVRVAAMWVSSSTSTVAAMGACMLAARTAAAPISA